jgi:hypothetical protein
MGAPTGMLAWVLTPKRGPQEPGVGGSRPRPAEPSQPFSRCRATSARGARRFRFIPRDSLAPINMGLHRRVTLGVDRRRMVFRKIGIRSIIPSEKT